MLINTRGKQHKKTSIISEYKKHKLRFWRNLKRRQLQIGKDDESSSNTMMIMSIILLSMSS